MGEALELFGVMMAIFIPITMLVFVNRYWDYKKKTSAELGRLKQQVDKQSTEEMEKQLRKLKERVAVLESIVTDRSYELERKIGDL